MTGKRKATDLSPLGIGWLGCLVEMNGECNFQKSNSYAISSPFLKRIGLLILLISLILVFFFGSELLARQGPGPSENQGYRPTLNHPSNCITCHEDSALGISAALKKSVPELCLGCHPDVAQSMKSTYKHSILSEGRCLVCHSIHSPSGDHLLKVDARSLCVGCHREQGESVAASAHGRRAAASCLDCHANHSSEIAGLLKEDSISLCSGCHSDLGPRSRNHPVGGMKDPLTGGELTCISSCHHPHGSSYEMMLKKPNTDGLCLSCHDMSFI